MFLSARNHAILISLGLLLKESQGCGKHSRLVITVVHPMPQSNALFYFYYMLLLGFVFRNPVSVIISETHCCTSVK